MTKKTGKLKKRKPSRVSSPKTGASGKMPAEPELVDAVDMLDGEPKNAAEAARSESRRRQTDVEN